MSVQQISRRRIVSLILIIACIWLLGAEQTQPGTAQAQTISPESITDEPLIDQLIIQYEPTSGLNSRTDVAASSQMARLVAATNTPLTYFREMSGEAHVLKLPNRLTATEALTMAERLEALPEVAYAEPDWILQPDFVPADPLWSQQWHFNAANGINLDDALDVTWGNRGMVVAVLDTGILLDHPDLSGRTVPGYDMVSDTWRGNDGDGRDDDPSDPGTWVSAADSSNNQSPCFGKKLQDSSWHGTHVAGTIGAATNNSQGVAGISQVQILPVRVLGKCGGNLSDAVDGIRWAVGITVPNAADNQWPARIINMSFGWSGACPDSFQSAINSALFQGAIVVVSAGNNNIDASNKYPANCAGVITVGATDQNGNRSMYPDPEEPGSNFGSTVEISAPGSGVLSTMNAGTTTPGAHNYDFKGGTSMATPHVAGVISLVLALRPTLNTEQLMDLLQYTAQPFPAGSSCSTSTCGVGIIDANTAVRDIFLIKGATNGLGLPSQPYGSLNEAYNAAWDGSDLKIKTANFGGNYTFDKEMTLTAVGGTVTIGQP